MVNTLKYLSFTVLLGTSFVALGDTIQKEASTNAIVAFAGDPWDYMEEVFITQPKNDAFKKTILKAIGITLAASLSSALVSELVQRLLEDDRTSSYPSDRFQKNACNTFYGFHGGIVGAIIGAFINSSAEKKLAYKACINTIKNWPQTREITPECFHQSFDKLHQLYKTNGKNDHIFKQNVETVLKQVIQAIKNHFSQKYYPPQIHNHNVNIPVVIR